MDLVKKRRLSYTLLKAKGGRGGGRGEEVLLAIGDEALSERLVLKLSLVGMGTLQRGSRGGRIKRKIPGGMKSESFLGLPLKVPRKFGDMVRMQRVGAKASNGSGESMVAVAILQSGSLTENIKKKKEKNRNCSGRRSLPGPVVRRWVIRGTCSGGGGPQWGKSWERSCKESGGGLWMVQRRFLSGLAGASAA